MTPSTSLPKVLICDDEPTFHLAVKHALKGKYDCRSANNSDEAATIVRNHPVDIVLLDVQMRTPDEGLKAIPRLREIDPELSIVMSSGLGDLSTVLESMRQGASDYVPKAFDPVELEIALERVLKLRRVSRRAESSDFEARANQSHHVMVGNSAKMLALRKSIEKFRRSAANVVITGETGTGKEVVARQLRGALPDGSLAPFVAIDSSTIQGSMAESILFGHEKGAFTGADRTARGLFEEADGGTVYFDEIANMPLEIQAKLLRVVQEREVMRLGSTKPHAVSFRVVCATNRDLWKMAESGLFKEDLYQRLNVLPLEVPPLRERKEDIPELVRHFVTRLPDRRALAFTDAALEALQSYRWPGNVRELGNLVAYVATMVDGEEVDLSDLPGRFRYPDSPGTPGSEGSKSFYERVAEFEKAILADEYRRLDGNVSRMALELGMDRSHLHSKLKQHGIHAARAASRPSSR